MSWLYTFFIAPFADFAFMQRALAGSLMLSLGACPVGVFLMLRRMSLSGDAMAHAILPGAAAGFLFYGLEILPMTVGGLIAGAVGAVIGTYGGAELRARMAAAFGRDLPAALVEDVIAIVGALLIVMAVA